MLRVRLRKLTSTHKNLRTNEVIGLCTDLPEVGLRFYILAASPNKKAVGRLVSTSIIQKIEVSELTDFYKAVVRTENSVYEVEVLEEIEEEKGL